MASKKRPHSEEEDTTAIKKRALVGPNGSPLVNGTLLNSQEEASDTDNLELFRKEAIFRRMKHYSRENERSQARITELERRKNTCEAGLAAMSACWAQLIETIRLLVKPEYLPGVQEDHEFCSIIGMFNFTHIQDAHTHDYVRVLADNMAATQTLVTKLAQLGEQPHFQMGAFPENQQATLECVALKSQVETIRAQLQESEAQKELFHTALITAENRLDRLRSGTVQAIQSSTLVDKQEPKEDTLEEPQRKPSSPSVSGSVNWWDHVHGNGVYNPIELEILHEQLKSREIKIIGLEKELAAIRDDKTLLEAEFKCLSLDKIAENPSYKVIIDRTAFLEASLSESREQTNRLTEELGSLRKSRKEWEEGVHAAATQASQELKTMLAKRDAENARLRDQREQQAAELNERKQKESIKATSFQELKLLADSRSDRIVVLESEVRRCKAHLAANTGNKDLMLFFADGNIENVEYIGNVKDRIITAENRAAALEQTLSIFQDDHPNVVEHMKAEADAIQKLAEARTELEKYKAVYGNHSTIPSDASELSEQLKQKEDEIERLRLLNTQRAQAETSLYAELDKLSAAWEALDRQVKSKVFDLSTMEERVNKTGLDRAKSENKFYAAMRDKEAIEAERKNLARNLEKQGKLIERLVDTERNLSAQVNDLEKEVVALRRVSDVEKEKMNQLELDLNHWQARAEGEKQKMGELHRLVNEREKIAEVKRAELRKLEDSLLRSKKELEHKLKDTIPVTGKQKDSETLGLLKLLKCSTCQQNFRNTVITKCMHTFCKQCVDTRITTRQRKCPVCGLGFAQSEVQTIFFQ
ncbi:BRE1 E3 ubiquitin ligase-domain-containing protein [Collybia nuda]|uniref:E3 ubiquitin protein ligase n=1 Tax=Collybia nuda TaxID=64659 RepID=A0A9P6CRT8_9AGAR|nr:BRE1 E3 ubiquitin ligase-domain-containing protein [Collybia nuda]